MATGGGNWLSVTPASGTGNGTLQVSVSAASLAAGSYSGTIVITAAGAVNSPVAVQVALTVAAAPRLTVGSSALTFQTAAGANPAAQKVGISNTGGGTLIWTAAASTSGGGNWLSVTPASGTGNGTLQVSVSAASLAAGSYTGTITITASGAVNSPATVQVSLTVTAPVTGPFTLSNLRVTASNPYSTLQLHVTVDYTDPTGTASSGYLPKTECLRFVNSSTFMCTLGGGVTPSGRTPGATSGTMVYDTSFNNVGGTTGMSYEVTLTAPDGRQSNTVKVYF